MKRKRMILSTRLLPSFCPLACELTSSAGLQGSCCFDLQREILGSPRQTLRAPEPMTDPAEAGWQPPPPQPPVASASRFQALLLLRHTTPAVPHSRSVIHIQPSTCLLRGIRSIRWVTTGWAPVCEGLLRASGMRDWVDPLAGALHVGCPARGRGTIARLA
jgi:hypothetical protein